jgi:hypothetical protein
MTFAERDTLKLVGICGWRTNGINIYLLDVDTLGIRDLDEIHGSVYGLGIEVV